MPVKKLPAKTLPATLLLLLFSLAGFGQSSFNYQTDFKRILAKTKTPGDSLNYEQLLKRFTAKDSSLTDYEVLSLMIGFTAQPQYKPYQDIDTEREIYRLNGEKKYKEALKLANTFLATHPLSIKALYEKSYAFHMLDKKDSADFYLFQGRRLIAAMHFSGDGKTADTPMFALGPADGQDYIYKHLGCQIGTMGSGKDKNGNFLDILQVKDCGDSSYILYFIIQHAEEKMFGGKSIEDELEELKKQDKAKETEEK